MSINRHSLKWRILLVLSISFLIHLAPTESCVYEFITHPDKKMSCNPVGSQLQLHCAVSGPSSPSFKLHWYMGTTEQEAIMLDSLPNYSTVSGEMELMNAKGNVIRKTVTSVLRTTTISDTHRDQCFWCQVEVEGMEISLYNYRHKVCLGDFKEFLVLPPCEDVVVLANMQVSCVALEDVRVLRQASNMDDGAITVQDEGSGMVGNGFATTAITPTSSQSNSAVSTLMPMVSPSPPRNSEVSRETSSTLSLPTTAAVTVTDTPIVAVSTAAPTNGTMPQAKSVEGGLLAAVTICVVFLIAIIFLVYIAICLSRNRCSYCRSAKEEYDIQRVENGNSNVLNFQEAVIVRQQTVPEDEADYDSLMPAIAEGESINGSGTTVTNPPVHQRQASAPPDVPPKPWKRDPNGPRSNYRYKSPPPLPAPLPQAVYNHPSETEDSHHDGKSADDKNSGAPPAVPQRTVSREHLYHTLECSSPGVDYAHLEDGEVIISPRGSQHGSRAGSYASSHHGSHAGSRAGSHYGSHAGSYAGSHRGSYAGSHEVITVDDSRDYSEVMDQGKLEVMSPTFMAQQIKELFDDPRYAMVVVEGMGDEEEEGEEDEEGGLSGRREMWRSTPSLVSTTITGRTGGDRRSLRLPQSVAVGRGRLIYS